MPIRVTHFSYRTMSLGGLAHAWDIGSKVKKRGLCECARDPSKVPSSDRWWARDGENEEGGNWKWEGKEEAGLRADCEFVIEGIMLRR
jgi:hypothetical protein